MGLLVKSATVFPGNAARGAASINGGVSLFSDRDGTLEAILDFHLVTKWKTAGDSLLAAPEARAAGHAHDPDRGGGHRRAQPARGLWRRLSRRGSSSGTGRRITPCGWPRGFPDTQVIDDLAAGVNAADVVTSATMTTTPILRGEWLRPGQHLDLIGAYRPDMREADDEVLRRGRLFVDARHTTIGHIGEVMIPMEAGVIGEEDILADYYDLSSGGFRPAIRGRDHRSSRMAAARIWT
jgi:ornithine cyclodeaminase/alanine dehydrogenase-like protein (mu-crystallin family)